MVVTALSLKGKVNDFDHNDLQGCPNLILDQKNSSAP